MNKKTIYILWAIFGIFAIAILANAATIKDVIVSDSTKLYIQEQATTAKITEGEAAGNFLETAITAKTKESELQEFNDLADKIRRDDTLRSNTIRYWKEQLALKEEK